MTVLQTGVLAALIFLAEASFLASTTDTFPGRGFLDVDAVGASEVRFWRL